MIARIGFMCPDCSGDGIVAAGPACRSPLCSCGGRECGIEEAGCRACGASGIVRCEYCRAAPASEIAPDTALVCAACLDETAAAPAA